MDTGLTGGYPNIKGQGEGKWEEGDSTSQGDGEIETGKIGGKPRSVCLGNQVKRIYQDGLGMVIVPDVAGVSSNLGTENWLLDLTTWGRGHWLAQQEQIWRSYGFFLTFFLFMGTQSLNATVFGAFG